MTGSVQLNQYGIAGAWTAWATAQNHEQSRSSSGLGLKWTHRCLLAWAKPVEQGAREAPQATRTDA